MCDMCSACVECVEKLKVTHDFSFRDMFLYEASVCVCVGGGGGCVLKKEIEECVCEGRVFM